MESVSKLDFYRKNKIQPMNLEGGVSFNSVNSIGSLDSVSSSGAVSGNFKETMANMINEMNEITSKPAQLTQDLMQGKADIHDVMAAVAKSELTVQTATTITGKILQTYEKIMQIQI